ncbi:histidinol-phosphatase HisJ family protein [Sunxiuqinia elliptica]|uniref:Histidinol-phosphatase n=1 Tax=Sunxiuqinia elliptica TaxID=655355 RepID=A0A4R6H3L3_9BACT|nr:histidinol-phosphatase HisJ family protein [Sunxiuqinia elliptica]TDO02763.1 histidinol-phosphatase (PHP family) [Sunxiuqinia elliptica]TDO58499.1 histidinol-phosphatase (PHP family) [Sunxiuqinia elliptica]
MLGLVDYHMHSILSDGKQTYEEMIKKAIEIGLEEVGFSDHVCLKTVEWAVSPIDIPVMTEQILELREKYQDQITVRYGIEMDYFPGKEKEIQEIISQLPLDYVIGSVHFIGDWNFDTDKSLYGKWSNDELYHIYYELIQQAAKSGLFDTIGHLDIIKKFRVYPENDQSQLIEDTLKVIKQNGLVVELNTGGLDRPCAELTPSPEIVEQCYFHHIPMTISSDAHSTAQLARHYETALNLMKKIGFEEIVTFENRTRKMTHI